MNSYFQAHDFWLRVEEAEHPGTERADMGTLTHLEAAHHTEQ